MPRYPTTTPTLFVIGGAEDRVGKASLLRHFLKLCGGRRARIVVIPTASSFQDEVVASYTEVFTRLGARRGDGRQPRDPRGRRTTPRSSRRVDGATGVFMSGGSQLRLSPAASRAPRSATRSTARTSAAASSAGTSAGASIMSDFMISMGDEGVTPRQRASQISAGLGLLRGVVVDQHFDQRVALRSPDVGHRPVPAPAGRRHRRGHRDGRHATAAGQVRGAGRGLRRRLPHAPAPTPPTRAPAPPSSCRARSCTRCPRALRSTSSSAG